MEGFKPRSSSTSTNTTTSNSRLDDVISYFTLQARYHLQQYQMYCYYAKYYAKYRRQLNKRDTDTASTCTTTKRTGHTTDSSCGYYFKNPKPNTFKTKKRTKRGNKRRRQRAHAESSLNTSTEVASGSKERVEVAEDIESSNDSDEEIDVGYQEFMRQSEQFRKERDAMRAKKGRQGRTGKEDEGEEETENDVPLECVEYVDVLRKGPDGTILPPTASNRKQMYEEKYGHAGTKILSLETALQWKFNNVVDATSPKNWPALPIRFINKN